MRFLYFLAGALLIMAAVANAQYSSTATSSASGGTSVSVNVAVNPGYPPAYTHYCYVDFFGYYNCAPYYQSFGYYCDPFDPFYYIYCYSPYSLYYPTYTINPGTVVYTASQPAQSQQPVQEPVQGPPCSDGTPAGFCSTDSPRYCLSNGGQSQLIDKASLCGCPAGEVQDPTNRNRCVAQTCEDGTALNACSSNRPSFCTSNGNLVERPSQCGCPSGSRLEGDSCVPLNSICFVSNNPQTVRQGESTTVRVSYSEVSNPNGFVDCGDGRVASLACSGGLTGTCVATCTYASQATYAPSAYINGELCSSQGRVEVAPPLPLVGDALVRVTSCSTSQALPGAQVVVNDQVLATNANGEARAIALQPGVQAVGVSLNGYETAGASTVVTQGRTSVTPVCLQRARACDVSLEPAGTITTNNVNNGVQLRLSNNLDESNSVALTYSSQVELNGPLVVDLAPRETRVINVYPTIPESFTGSSIASISARGKEACSANIDVPLNLNSGLTIAALTTSQTSHAGGRACFDLMLTNKGQRTRVNMFANSTGLGFEFDNNAFILASEESRPARLCVDVPQGATGSRTIEIRAVGANEAVEFVELGINQFMYSDVLGCFDAGQRFVEVQLTNTGPSESFEARLMSSTGFSPRLTQPNLFNFVNQSTRSLFIETSDMQGTEARATLSIFTRDEVKIFEQELCFRKQGTVDSIAFLSPSRISVQQGKTSRAFVYIENTGNVADIYAVEVVPAFNTIGVASTSVSLVPGEQRPVELTLSPVGADAGTYIVPVLVYSLHDPALRTEIAQLNLVVDVLESEEQLRLVLATEPGVQFDAGTSTIRLTVPVINYEDGEIRVTPFIEDLPENWTYSVEPVHATLSPLEQAEFSFLITTKNLEPRDYNATIVFADEQGREARQPVSLPAKSRNWAVTGFFALGSGDAFAFLVVILVLVGLFYLYKALMLRQAVRKEQLEV